MKIEHIALWVTDLEKMKDATGAQALLHEKDLVL